MSSVGRPIHRPRLNAARERLPFSETRDGQPTGRGAPTPGSAPTGTRPPSGPSKRIGLTRRRALGAVESTRRTLRPYPFASERFHVLLNSLFKVLFNFPSRYLFAIGLVSVFSLRWSLPPTLGCIPKQPDSREDVGDAGRSHTGLTPSLARPRSEELGHPPDAAFRLP